MNIGLFFGSFNPIHIGHCIITNYILEFTDIDEVWFIISPQNPFKQTENLLDENIRLEIVNLAIKQNAKMLAKDIEFNMPKPSYTIDTLKKLQELHKEHNFSIILGSDNLKNIDKWKDANIIVDSYQILVYPRLNYDIDKINKNIKILSAPIVEISSSFIRENINKNRNLKFFLPPEVYLFIKKNKLYQK